MSGRQEIERSWEAPLQVIWELWSTPEGVASWWGPRGFRVEVEEMDLRIGGHFRYTMHAETAEMAAMMEQRGRPASFSVTATYTEIEKNKVIAWDSPFGDEKLTTRAEFMESEGTVRLMLVIDATQPNMTGGAAQGWKSALGKFEELLARP